MKPLMILAGGYGTRLRSLVSDVPKPLAPVLNKPFVEYLIDRWVKQGVEDFIFLLHYEAEKIIFMLNELSCRHSFSNINFRTIVENNPLGTGGAILNAVNHFGIYEEFLVANADTWLSSGIEQLLGSKFPTIAAVPVQNSARYGSLKFKGEKICAFKEKSNDSSNGYINSGLYYLSPDIFDGFVAGSKFSLEKEVFPKLISERKLGVKKLKSSFIDIGIPDDYLKFCKWVESGKIYEI